MPYPKDAKDTLHGVILASTMSGQSLPGREFLSTHWSLVLRAGDLEDVDSSNLALQQLCSAYWYPLYAFVRRSGKSEEDAKDLTQGFFAKILSHGAVAVADPSRGRFRSFLLRSIKNYMSSEWRKENAQKRGGGAPNLSLDAEDAERRYRIEPAGSELSPEELYDRRWARAVLEQVLATLKKEFRRSGKSERFEVLKGQLLSEPEPGEYEACAETLGLEPSALRTQIYRMRNRFGLLLREQIEQTVAEPSQVDEEISYLLQALG